VAEAVFGKVLGDTAEAGGRGRELGGCYAVGDGAGKEGRGVYFTDVGCVQGLARETGKTGTDRGREDGDCEEVEEVEEEEKERLMMHGCGRDGGRDEGSFVSGRDIGRTQL